MPAPITFTEISRLWLLDKQQYVRKSTIATYSYTITSQLIPAFGDMTLIREEDVQKFANAKISEGLSRKTVRDFLVILKMILWFASKQGFMPYQQMDIHLPTPREKAQLSVLSIDQQKRLIDYVKNHPDRESIGLQICLFCGLRIGEICALQWKDLDLENGLLSVNKTLQRIYVNGDDGENRTELVIDAPKTKESIREIPVPLNLCKLLQPFKDSAGDDCFVLSGKTTPVEPRVYRTYFKRLMKRLNLPDIRFHALRHSFATRCIDGNCDYKTVSVLLGHASISTTLNLYVHPNIEQKRRVVESMSSALD